MKENPPYIVVGNPGDLEHFPVHLTPQEAARAVLAGVVFGVGASCEIIPFPYNFIPIAISVSLAGTDCSGIKIKAEEMRKNLYNNANLVIHPGE